MDHIYAVYMMASATGTLYTGVTGDLYARVLSHKQGLMGGFTKKYRCYRLVYFEEYETGDEAYQREKQIKGLKRWKKERLIRSMNPHWNDLSIGWYLNESPITPS